ncbi:MAG: response regulator transcription factor [Phycisphaeraceae bacterium]|nr:response regulator transcription factor [Phycisphaeraceae bacterium]
MKIMLVDPHPMFRRALAMLIQAQEQLEVVAEVEQPVEAVRVAGEIRPEVVLLDSVVTGQAGLEVARQMSELRPAPAIIALCDQPSRSMILGLFRAGVMGVISRSCTLAILLEGIEHARQGRRYMCPLLYSLCDPREIEHPEEAAVQRRGSVRDSGALSQREKQVLQLLSEGMSNKEMAQKLEVSVKTIDTHRQHIMDKLNLRTVAGLTKYALRQGLTTLG